MNKTYCDICEEEMDAFNQTFSLERVHNIVTGISFEIILNKRPDQDICRTCFRKAVASALGLRYEPL